MREQMFVHTVIADTNKYCYTKGKREHGSTYI